MACLHKNAAPGETFWYCKDCHQVVDAPDVREAKARAQAEGAALVMAYRHLQTLPHEAREAFLWKLWAGMGSGVPVADRILDAMTEKR